MTQLPSGIYAISPAFAGKTDEVIFSFKSISYTAAMGVQAFSSFEDAMAVQLTAPAEPFAGQSYSTPVILMPAGTFKFGSASATPLSQPVTLLGEGAASRTEGSFYHGTFTVPEGTPGCITIRDLTLFNTRVYDQRTSGSDLGLTIQNCSFEGALTKNLIYAAPLADASCRRACLFRRRSCNFCRPQGAGDGLGMGRKDDGIARLQGDHGFIAHGGGGVGAGHNGRDDTHRHTDLP